MRFVHPKLFAQQTALVLLGALLLFLLLKPREVQAQRSQPPAVAQVGPGNPLPVYVVNDVPPSLPEGFIPGSSWKFTTWTIPSTLTFTATVQKTDGGWALLKLTSSSQPAASWYYVPQMPGTWEQQ